MTTETDVRYQCDAHIGRKQGEYGFEFVRCGQTVATRGYWTSLSHFVAYCPIPGHEANVRLRCAEVDAPWPGDLPVDHPEDATVESEYATYWSVGATTR